MVLTLRIPGHCILLTFVSDVRLCKILLGMYLHRILFPTRATFVRITLIIRNILLRADREFISQPFFFQSTMFILFTFVSLLYLCCVFYISSFVN